MTTTYKNPHTSMQITSQAFLSWSNDLRPEGRPESEHWDLKEKLLLTFWGHLQSSG